MRKLTEGQVYTSHDGTELFRRIEEIYEGDVFYRTNRNGMIYLHRCKRSTFVAWIRVRRARKTQKYRRRQIMGSP